MSNTDTRDPRTGFVESRYSRLTSVGIRGLLLVAAGAVPPYLGYSFFGINEVLGMTLVIVLPVFFVGLATSTGSPRTKRTEQIEKIRDPESKQTRQTPAATDYPVEVFGKGTGFDWMMASGLVIGAILTLNYYGFTGTEMVVLTALPFVMMLALDQG